MRRLSIRFGIGDIKLLAAGSALALLAIPLNFVIATPALADTFLCVGSDYSTCINAGYTDHDYHVHNGTSYWNAFTGHNCTNYVAYTQTLLGVPEPAFKLGDAWQWWSQASGHVPEDQVPSVGAVAWWGQNQPGAGSGGHVAYIEAVSAGGSITISEDAYPKGPFAWRMIPPGSADWPGGFIHFKAAVPGSSPTPTPNVPWNFENLDGTATSPGGHVANLGLNPTAASYQGVLHVFYYDPQGGYLRHAWKNSGGWHFEVLDGAGGTRGRNADNTGAAPVVVTGGQALNVFYYDVTTRALRRSWLSANRWSFQTLDKSGNAGSASAAVWYHGTLQVFYPALASGYLRHAWTDAAGDWRFENFDGGLNSVAGLQSSNAPNSGDSLAATVYQGAVRLFYHSAGAGTLRYAWNDPAGWHFASLDGGLPSATSGDADQIGQNPSVTVAAGRLHVFTGDATLGDLRHDWYDGSAWHFENLDGPGTTGPDHFKVGLYSATLLDGATLRVFYYDSSYGELRQAYTGPGQAWQFQNLDGLGGLPATRLGPGTDVGRYVSAMSYQGVPQLFYYDATHHNLRHAWAS